jgi:ubiquinone/menaquinone biosynthesis C-methylase UbiE
MPQQLALARERKLPNARFVEGSADDLGAFPDGSLDAVLDFCILHHVEGWRTFFDECRRVLKDGGSVYIADLSRKCIHLVDALLRWDHAEEALFSLEELEGEADSRGFRTVKKAIDLGLEGYFRFQKE